MNDNYSTPVESPLLLREITRQASDLESFLRALQSFNSSLPPRTTTRQLEVFLEIALQCVKGRWITLSDVKNTLNDRKYGLSSVENIGKNYRLFMDDKGANKSALCWLTLKNDASDLRKKYFVLTYRGQRAITSVSLTARNSRP